MPSPSTLLSVNAHPDDATASTPPEAALAAAGRRVVWQLGPAVLGGWGASLVVHAVILSVLGTVTFLTPRSPAVQSFDASITEMESAPDLEAFTTRPTSFRSGKTVEGGGSKGKTPLAPVASAPVRPDFGALASLDAPLATFSGEGPVNPGAKVAELGSGFGEGVGAGMGNGVGDGVGDGNGTYFGMKGDSSSVVFVVDASSSMNRPYPGFTKSRFGRVKFELLKSISQMSPEQQFFVIFFSEDAYPMPARNLVPASPGNQQIYMRWVAEAKALGNTNPENALVAALKLKPETIYFLTDGNFNYRSVKAAKRYNPTKIPIHTIGFGDNTGEDRMKEIAAESGGTYRFIPEETADQQAASGIPLGRP